MIHKFIKINISNIYNQTNSEIKFKSLMCYLQYHNTIFIMQHQYQLLIQINQLLIQ